MAEKRKILGKTDRKCDLCGKANFQIVEGTETTRMLYCPKCGQMYYNIGVISCGGTARVNTKTGEVFTLSYEEVERLLGAQTLTPRARRKANKILSRSLK